MTSSQTLRGWGAVHGTGPAAALLVAVTVASALGGEVRLPGLSSVVLFRVPLPLPILLGAVAGIAAAVACHNAVRLPLGDPVRAKVARAAWALAWTGFAALVGNLNILTGTADVMAAVTRNTVLYAAVGLLTVRFATVNLVWLPCLGLMLTSMLFGDDPTGPPGGYYWWAIVVSPSVSSSQWIAVTAVYLLAVVAYVVPRSASRILDAAAE